MMALAATTKPTILSRLERLDIMMGYLEEIRGSRIRRSSAASTASSGTVIMSDGDGDGGNSSLGSSPKSLEKLCRPIEDVIMEMQLKGTIVHRLQLLEDQILKLSMHMEEEIEAETKMAGEKSPGSGKKMKNLKSLVKSCVGANHKAKD